jgi:diguanylate cyclase (GGDEF)-like protein
MKVGDYFRVAATRRFRASQRRRIRTAVRQGLLLTAAVAILGSLALATVHRDAAGQIFGLNAGIGVIAVVGLILLATGGRRHPEAIIWVLLMAIDIATVALGWLQPGLRLVSLGYLLVLPTVVALLIPWATGIHLAWLGLHVALSIGYAVFAPAASIEGGERVDMITLMVVATAASQFGHMAALRARVLSFVQIDRIRTLNRLASRDRTRLDRLNSILAATARVDDLTGLGNRRLLTEDLVAIRSGIKRHADHCGILMLDLDRFKSVNDGLGHVEGDRVLRVVADAIGRSIRPDDRAYRFGGEEFMVLMRLASEADAMRAAERVRTAVEDLAIVQPGNLPYGRVTISAGVAVVGPDDLEQPDGAWFARADAALYQAKAEGRNRSRSWIATGEP